MLAADPQTVGQIRDALNKRVEKKVVLTLDKDLTNHPIPKIARALG